MMVTADRHSSSEHPAKSRLERMLGMLGQDPGNALLLGDTAEAAIAAGEFAQANELIDTGLRQEPGSASWLFRQATLRIAQRRLDEATEILRRLQETGGNHPSTSHNLAFIQFVKGDFAACADVLRPLLDASVVPPEQEGALQALWLRATHHMGALDEAWAFVERRMKSGSLSPAAAGVASLVALDRSDLPAARQLSQQAIDAGAAQVEAFVARASTALSSGDVALTKMLLQQALQLSPKDGRSWSTLGLAHSIEQDFAGARIAFDNAVAAMPQHADSWQGLGWACVMLGDLPSAANALDNALSLDDTNADSHGARAVVHALSSEKLPAEQHVARSLALDAGNVSAQFAQRILSGEITRPQDVQQLLRGGPRK